MSALIFALIFGGFVGVRGHHQPTFDPAVQSEANAYHKCNSTAKNPCTLVGVTFMMAGLCKIPILSVWVTSQGASQGTPHDFSMVVGTNSIGLCRTTTPGKTLCFQALDVSKVLSQNPGNFHVSAKFETPSAAVARLDAKLSCNQTSDYQSNYLVHQQSTSGQLKCMTKGCQDKITFTIDPKFNCPYAQLLFQFRITDFGDRTTQKMDVFVTDTQPQNRIGSCVAYAVGATNLGHVHTCFENMDLTRLIGTHPTSITIVAKISNAVSKIYMNIEPAPFLLDAHATLSCSSTSLTSLPQRQVAVPGVAALLCMNEIPCNSRLKFVIPSHQSCNHPVLDFDYFLGVLNWSESQILMNLNDKFFGKCAPLFQTATSSYDEAVPIHCAKAIPVRQWLIPGNNTLTLDVRVSLTDPQHGPQVTWLDTMKDKVFLGNASLTCETHDVLRDNTFEIFSGAKQSFPVRCAGAGCSSALHVTMNSSCQYTYLEFTFYETDFGSSSEQINMSINGIFYGLCDANQDNSRKLWHCVNLVDISQYVGSYPSRIDFGFQLTPSTDVVEWGVNGMLLDGFVTMECGTQSGSHVAQVLQNPSQASVTLKPNCTGIGCQVEARFDFGPHYQCTDMRLDVGLRSWDLLETRPDFLDIRVGNGAQERCTVRKFHNASDDFETCISNRLMPAPVPNSPVIVSMAMSPTDVVIDFSYKFMIEGRITMRCNRFTVDVNHTATVINAPNQPKKLSQSCSSPHCAKGVSFKIAQAVLCRTPLLTLSFTRANHVNNTDFVVVFVNQHQLLGNCIYDPTKNCVTKLPLDEYTGSSRPNDVNISYYTDTSINVVATVELECNQQPIVFSSSYSATTQAPALMNLKCLHTNCQQTGTYTVTGGSCAVPRLTLDFWLTDFSAANEYLTVFVAGAAPNSAFHTVGRCSGDEELSYAQIYRCFQNVDVHQLIGKDILGLQVKLGISPHVNNKWLNLGPTPYILDATVSLQCLPTPPALPGTSAVMHSAGLASTACAFGLPCSVQVDYISLQNCQYPMLSASYQLGVFSYHEQKVQLLIGNKHVGHCHPSFLTGQGHHSTETVRNCLTNIPLASVVTPVANRVTVLVGLKLTLIQMDVNGGLYNATDLDHVNGFVMKANFNLTCAPKSDLHLNRFATHDGLQSSPTTIPVQCPFEDCTSKVTVTILNCPRVIASFSFYNTDFSNAETEYVEVKINSKVFGQCSGFVDGSNASTSCFDNADLTNHIGASPQRAVFEFTLSHMVNDLSTTHNGLLLDGNLVLSCSNLGTLPYPWVMMPDSTRQETLETSCVGFECTAETTFKLQPSYKCHDVHVEVQVGTRRKVVQAQSLAALVQIRSHSVAMSCPLVESVLPHYSPCLNTSLGGITPPMDITVAMRAPPSQWLDYGSIQNRATTFSARVTLSCADVVKSGSPTTQPTPQAVAGLDCRNTQSFRYLFLNESMTWPQAQGVCVVRFGGSLASLHSNFDQAEAHRTLACAAKIGHTLYTGDVWIGFSSSAGTTRWDWSDNSIQNYTNWDASNINEQPLKMCAVFSKQNGKWAKKSCDQRALVLCEKTGVLQIHVKESHHEPNIAIYIVMAIFGVLVAAFLIACCFYQVKEKYGPGSTMERVPDIEDSISIGEVHETEMPPKKIDFEDEDDVVIEDSYSAGKDSDSDKIHSAVVDTMDGNTSDNSIGEARPSDGVFQIIDNVDHSSGSE